MDVNIFNTKVIIINTINTLKNAVAYDFIKYIECYILTLYEIIDALDNLSNNPAPCISASN